MKYVLKDKTLTLYFEGELNSFNSEDVENEIEEILNSNDNYKKLVLDLEKLKYISSAGLRIIVKLKQENDDLKLVKVPEGVYDVFEMVGFQNIVEIERL